jgi:hypothetical protein
MAEDMEDMAVPLPVLSNVTTNPEVKRGEVFCSKIIHQKATHQSRFTRSELHQKIVEYSNCIEINNNVYSRPLSSPFPCFHCHRSFTCPPIFIPIVALNGKRTEWGNFCRPGCANAYLHANMNNSNLAARVADLHEYCQDVHGFTGDSLGFAPHFSMLTTYGGSMTPEQFDMVAATPGLRTHERTAPFIPTEVVVEWQCRVEDSGKEDTPVAASVFGNKRTHALSSAAAAKSKTATEELSRVMGTGPEAVHHHHQWEVRGLKQDSQEAIERRLLSLPRPEQKEGLYDLYWKRHGSGAPMPDDEEKTEMETETARPAPPAPTPTKINKRKPAPKPDPSQGLGLGAKLVPTKRTKY